MRGFEGRGLYVEDKECYIVGHLGQVVEKQPFRFLLSLVT